MFDGSENLAPADAKKARIPLSKRGSALPRFQVGQRKSAESESEEVVKPAASVTTEAEKLTPIKNSLMSVVNGVSNAVFGTGTKDTVKSPVRSPVRDGRTPSKRRIRTSKQPATPPPKIESLFDSILTVNEQKLFDIVGHMKVKSKWDYKEKATKQAVVIVDLRTALKTTLEEIKQLKAKCVDIETNAISTIHSARVELEETGHTVLQLADNEKQQDKELAVMRAERELVEKSLGSNSEEMKSKLEKAEADATEKEIRLKELEIQQAKLMEKLSAEDTTRQQLESDARTLRVELDEARQNIVEATSSAHTKYEEKVESTIAQYKDEISVVKMDVDRKQCEIERMSAEKQELERKFSDLRDSQLRAESSHKDVTMNIDRCQADITRLTEELRVAKEQLIQKDDDIRSTFKSIAEMQRDGVEEKGKLRAEASALQERLMGLEQERLVITAQLASKTTEVESVTRELANLREQVVTLQAKVATQDQEIAVSKDAVVQLAVERELRVSSEVREDTERRERTAASGQLYAIQRECDLKVNEMETEIKKQGDDLRQQLKAVSEKRDEAVEELRVHVERIAGLESEIQSLHTSLNNASANLEQVEELSKVSGELEVLRRRLADSSEKQASEHSAAEQKVKELEAQLLTSEMARRQLHNKIQELRGNVRVFARVRPFLPNDGVDLADGKTMDATITTKPDGTSLRIKHTAAAIAAASACSTEQYSSSSASARSMEADTGFAYDKVFGPSCGQETVFQEVSEFVQSALDGYNVTLFSYGQTGSGKTHTMQGCGNGNMRGIIPRAMEQVGAYKLELESKGWEYSMEVSFLEIYNETIRDLLRTSNDDCKHEIKKDMNGNTTVTDISMLNIDPNDTKQVEGVMELAARHRSVSATNMNEQSSRSHSVFALHLKASNAAQGISLKGTLSLVDLAGSERLDRSGAVGARLKETVAINKSLSSLTDVFVAIGNKQGHIPFRNSKLTYLLQNSLSGDGKTLMMVNLSPTEESFGESMCSLKFAQQVNQCELGKPKRQIKDMPADNSGCETPAPKSTSTARSTAAPSTSSTAKRTRTPVKSATASRAKISRV